MTLLTYQEVADVFCHARPTLERLVAHRLNCRETARDLTHDIFFKLARLADRFASREDARNFIIRMAINAATDHFRVERRRSEILGEADIGSRSPDDPEICAQTNDAMRRIGMALADLPPKCRDVLYLSRIEGLTHGEVAERLGVSRSLVDKYAVRALLHCRAALGPVSD